MLFYVIYSHIGETGCTMFYFHLLFITDVKQNCQGLCAYTEPTESLKAIKVVRYDT